MCGITGFWDFSGESNTDRMQVIVRRMSDTLKHRGPDDGGVWVDQTTGIALGHRRLAIVDLSPLGHQPMASANGRYILVFNGEIYNFLQLRQELAHLGYRFRGESDTEVMLAAFSEWGLERSLSNFNGMFAFALWDRQEQRLHLGRDRLGEKPLYYGWVGSTFVFSSELKALKAYPDFPAQINRDALALYLRHNYIPAPYSIYQDIYKLPPASVLTVQTPDSSHLHPVSYWSVQSVAQAGIAHPFPGDETEAIAQLDALLRDAISLRMVADVPLGAFLSGGVDSSTIVALMQVQSRKPIKTFTIGFYEDDYNEAQHAKAVAHHLATDHTELYVTPKDAIAVIPKLPSLYDEPFSDSSGIPTFLLSQLTRKYVTVSLSGDGGDELFAGYNRYFWGRRIWQTIGWIPKPLRLLAASTLTTLSPETWNHGFAQLSPLLPPPLRQRYLGDKLHKLAEVLGVASSQALYRGLMSHWSEPESLVWGSSEPATALNTPQAWAALPDFTRRMMYLDTVTYLPDDILVKVDRASMGVSLETRIPYLDHRIVELVWRMPLAVKIRHNQGKWLLRQVLYQYVPKPLIERPKMGFGVPINSWLRESLRDWAEALLDEHRLWQEGFFNPQPIRQKWQEHLQGDRNWQYPLWDILMFQAWLDEQAGS